MGKRKTVQVSEKVHARLDEFWRKISLGFDYDRSSSGVIDYLMDFYDRNRSPEMEIAMQLISVTKQKLEQVSEEK